MLIKNYTEYKFLQDYGFQNNPQIRILNAGSSTVRYGENCVNIDIQNKPNVDVVCDIHELPHSLGQFDVIICNGVLQYCHNPKKVAAEFLKALKPDGYLFLDAPFIQPYCEDTADKFRFSKDGLLNIFSEFSIIEINPSIRAGSAFAFMGERLAANLTGNKYANYALQNLAKLLLCPFCWLNTHYPNKTAGAFYLIAKKSPA